MAFEGRGFIAVLLHILLCSFFSFLSAEFESDISCLKSIKDSLEDPYDSLHTWDFKNQSKSYICHHFEGVSCYNDQLLSIELGSRGLKGQLPWGIMNCSSLMTLDLSNNSLSGHIPSHIFSMLPSLYNLDLSHNIFCDEIPTSIGGLTGLYTLDLSNNKFSGEIPASIGYLTHLGTLDLSNNKFSGEIPASIGDLTSLGTLDLSNNKFSGEIPASIGDLTSLVTLDLSNNKFSGEIPPQLGELLFLTEFSVANNLLSGPVPAFHGYFDVSNKESYWNNSGLCGGPLEPCERELRDPFHQSFREGLIAGYVFSATSVIVVYVSYFVPWTQLKKARGKKPLRAVGPYTSYIIRKRETEQQREENQTDKLHNKSVVHKKKRCQETQITEGLACKMSFIELCDATDFYRVEGAIGAGSSGIMYKARLPNGWSVAVKRPYDSQLFKRQFNLEIMILGRCRHKNIVPLLGFCIERVENVERKERILVYKYMPNGKLSDWLSKENGDLTLNWPLRVRVALGIARGLCWLHHNLHVVHFSICSECILLDQNFEPKISNFAEAKFTSQNIFNYLDKSFYIDNPSNNEFGFEKVDVYNFGTVLLELLSGKRYNPRTGSFFCNDGSVVVTDTTCLSICPSGFREAIDKFLIGQGFDDEIFTLLTIACYCIQPFLDQRPTMLEVYTKMSNIWERHELSQDFQMSENSEVASAATARDEIVELESM